MAKSRVMAKNGPTFSRGTAFCLRVVCGDCSSIALSRAGPSGIAQRVSTAPRHGIWRAMQSLPLVVAALVLLVGCAPVNRARRVLGPDHYVYSETPEERHAQVLVRSGWQGEALAPYSPRLAYIDDDDGERWVRPVIVADRGQIRVVPRHDDVTIRLYARSTGLRRRGFRPLLARSGTGANRNPTQIRFLPKAPLREPWVLDIRDLQNVWSGDRLLHGDLLLLEVARPGAEPDRYLFDTHDFGFRTRFGAGVLVRVPLQSSEDSDAPASPAIVVSMALGYRFRTQNPVVEFLGERVMLIGSAGVGSAVLENVSGPINDQLQGAFQALVVGGGLEFFEFLSVQLLINARAPFLRGLEPGWTLAAGFDAVQAGRFFGNLGEQLLREHPSREDRREDRRDE